ncbi:MAG: DegT/DnrJ/EryC1/StrS aminotransferase family protein [Thermoguttaceae bacterium]|nr:DegT/DnrJ/EryC1/StrS aminotransferase family protein [Thermoguttaceae bacterium]
MNNDLALFGGRPLRDHPLPTWPVFDDEDTEAVAAVLRSGRVNYWTGEQGRLFEEEFAEYVGCRHAVAVANGTLALELSLEALGIGPGDDVVVTCRSFVASAACVVRRGARPIFADVDRDSQNITAETVRAAITPNTRAIIAVHLAGWPCEMGPLRSLADEYYLRIVEDCAQAHGATYCGRQVGSLGDLAAFSFCQDKILTTAGEGGMVTTNDDLLWQRLWSLKDHGKNWAACCRIKPGHVFQWLHQSIGTNARMTEVQAAVGRTMLRKLPWWVSVRQRNAAWLADRLGRLPSLRIARPPAHVGHSFYKFYAFVRPDHLRAGWSRDRIVEALHAEGIPCGSGACPEIYAEKAFTDLGFGPQKPLRVAHELAETSLMLLVHPTLAEQDLADTCRAVEKVMAAACHAAAPAHAA